jgi:hypothetical protein
MRAVDKRLDKLRGAIIAAPVLPHVMDEAYEWFTMFGELPEEPEEDNVALAVMRRALNGGADPRPADSQEAFAEQLREVQHIAHMSVREPLFAEAMHKDPFVRTTARSAITVEVAYHADVESPAFASRRGLPVFGTVGMHVLGFPGRWVVPPYEDQGERLLRRYDELRSRIDQRRPNWFDPIRAALLAFHIEGTLPKDALMLELALADAELDLHRANKRGQDVAEQMALFNRIARGEGEERDEALRRVCELALAGKLIPALKDAPRRRTTLSS